MAEDGAGQPAPAPAPARRWAELDLLAKLTRVLSVALVGTYLSLALAQGLPRDHPLASAVAPLARKLAPLRLSSPWTMFVKEARFGYIVLETELSNGERYEIESFRWEGKTRLERLRDARLRRLQAKLKSKRDRRRWGPAYLAHVCETTRRSFPELEPTTIEVIRKRPELFDAQGKRTARAKAWRLAQFDCGSGRMKEGG